MSTISVVCVVWVVAVGEDCAARDVCDDSEEAEEVRRRVCGCVDCTTVAGVLRFVSVQDLVGDPRPLVSVIDHAATAPRAIRSWRDPSPSSRAALF